MQIIEDNHDHHLLWNFTPGMINPNDPYIIEYKDAIEKINELDGKSIEGEPNRVIRVIGATVHSNEPVLPLYHNFTLDLRCAIADHVDGAAVVPFLIKFTDGSGVERNCGVDTVATPFFASLSELETSTRINYLAKVSRAIAILQNSPVNLRKYTEDDIIVRSKYNDKIHYLYHAEMNGFPLGKHVTLPILAYSTDGHLFFPIGANQMLMPGIYLNDRQKQQVWEASKGTAFYCAQLNGEGVNGISVF